MKKRTLTICAAAAMVLGSLSFASAQGGITPPIDQNDAPDHKTYICHTPGHELDRILTGPGFACLTNRDGIILLVAKSAACTGHKITNRFCRDQQN